MTTNTDPTPPPAPYRVETLPNHVDIIETAVNQRHLEGWDLHTIVPIPATATTPVHLLVTYQRRWGTVIPDQADHHP